MNVGMRSSIVDCIFVLTHAPRVKVDLVSVFRPLMPVFGQPLIIAFSHMMLLLALGFMNLHNIAPQKIAKSKV